MRFWEKVLCRMDGGVFKKEAIRVMESRMAWEVFVFRNKLWGRRDVWHTPPAFCLSAEAFPFIVMHGPCPVPVVQWIERVFLKTRCRFVIPAGDATQYYSGPCISIKNAFCLFVRGIVMVD